MWRPVEVVGGEGGGGGQEAPCARGKHAAAAVGAAVYVAGGRGAGGALPLRDCWRYHIPSGRWERLRARGDAPPALQEHSAVAHGARLYVFGGEASLSSETPLWVLDTETLIWRKVAGGGGAGGGGGARRGRSVRPLAPTGRRGHSAHALNDCMLIYGGYKDLRGSTNELWAFHYETETWQAVRTGGAAGPARHGHAAALHGARLYVHGGRCDLRVSGDLWLYDTLARAWRLLRLPPRLAPAPRAAHAGLPVGPYFYIFGGEVDGHPTNELWRFHFVSETWERMAAGLQWPAPRVDACVLLLEGVSARVRSAACGRGRGAEAERRADDREPPGLISRLASFHLRRSARCAYSVLGERDSTESLVREPPLGKSRSAYVIDGRLPADGGEGGGAGDGGGEADDAADSEAEWEARARGRLPKSASVRFSRDAVTVTTEEEGELSTSDYASAERVHRLAFSNPHYLGPDVRALAAPRTPDSGAGDIELQDLSPRARAPAAARQLLLLGGREPSHPARLCTQLAMWTYRLD